MCILQYVSYQSDLSWIFLIHGAMELSRFPQHGGSPSHHPFLIGIFRKTTSDGGDPPLMEAPISGIFKVSTVSID